MNIQKWLLIAGVVLLLGAASLVALSYVAPYALAQGPMGGWWNGPGDGFGPGSGMMGRGMMGRGMMGGDFGPGFGQGPGGMMGRGMMFDDDFGPGFGWGPGGMMGWGGPENSVISIAAEKLGLTTAELQAELQAGKTIAAVAAEKNVAVDTIVEAVIAPRSERLSQLVTNGQLTQEQADAMLAQMKTNITERLNEAGSPRDFAGPRGMMGGWMMGPGMMGGGHWGGGMMGPGMMGGRWGGPENSLISVVTEKLGLTHQELLTELQAGKSIAEIAKEKDIALKTIVDAVLAPRTERLNQLVTNGQLTQTEVDSRLANLRVDLIDWLNQSWNTPQNTTPGAAPDGSGSF